MLHRRYFSIYLSINGQTFVSVVVIVVIIGIFSGTNEKNSIFRYKTQGKSAFLFLTFKFSKYEATKV